MNFIKKHIERVKFEQSIYFAITGPALGAINLMALHPEHPDTNLAMVHRTQNWCWSTYDHLAGPLSPKTRKRIIDVLEALGQRINEFDWSTARAEDGWTEAMNFYEEHECG